MRCSVVTVGLVVSHWWCRILWSADVGMPPRKRKTNNVDHHGTLEHYFQASTIPSKLPRAAASSSAGAARQAKFAEKFYDEFIEALMGRCLPTLQGIVSLPTLPQLYAPGEHI